MPVEGCVAAKKPYRITCNEPTAHRIIVPRPVIIESDTIILPPGEPEGVRAGRSGDGSVSKGREGIGRRKIPSGIREGDAAPEGIREVMGSPGRVGPAQGFVNRQTPEIRRLAAGAILPDDVSSLVQETRALPVHCFRGPSPKPIIRKCRAHRGTAEAHEAIPG